MIIAYRMLSLIMIAASTCDLLGNCFFGNKQIYIFLIKKLCNYIFVCYICL